MVIIEAMAAGLPIVATTVGAIPEIIKNGENGFLVRPKDIQDLSSKIEVLLKNSNLRENISKNNIEKVKNNYSVYLQVDFFRRLYYDVMNQKNETTTTKL